MNRRILGIVTDQGGRFICRRCHAEVEMVAVIDMRNTRAKVWREVTKHECVAAPEALSAEASKGKDA